MTVVRMRVVEPMTWQDRWRKAGDEIDVPEDAARILKLLGKIAEVDEARPEPRGRYRRRDLRADE